MQMFFDEKLAELQRLLPRLGEKDQQFARSLLDAAGGRGLTPKQTKWVDVLYQRAQNPEAKRDQAIGAAFKGVVDLLDKAATNLKFPRLLFRADGFDYRLTIAGPMASTPGSINVTDTGKSGDRKWFGRVSREGVFEPSRAITDEAATAIAAALKVLAEDPAGAAKVYGQQTGACCFCGLELTNKRSIVAGYGPVCAEKWGLPWGA